MAGNYVLITGASSGIGKSTALMLVDKGFTVFTGVRKEEDAEDLQSLNPELIPVFIDVTDDLSISEAYRIISEKTQKRGLFGLVNNAGISVAGPLEFLPIEKLKLQFDVNVIGQVKVIQTFLPLIRKASGRIVNISSTSGFTAFPFIGAYSASKFALEAISDSLRRELSSYKIYVSVIQPGIINTNIWERSINMLLETIEQMPEGAREFYGYLYETLIEKVQKKVEKNAIPPEYVAKAVLNAMVSKSPKTRYLVGKDAHFLNILKLFSDKFIDKLIVKPHRFGSRHILMK
jgi:NAD(P)-dependent dehydrogenase (short-subunit alcohol dehydrogenase family)